MSLNFIKNYDALLIICNFKQEHVTISLCFNGEGNVMHICFCDGKRPETLVVRRVYDFPFLLILLNYARYI